MAETISFARGAPSLDIIDIEGLKASAVEALDGDPGGVTAYGTAVGYLSLREMIAAEHGVEPDQVLVTNGSMQADAFLFDAVTGPGVPVVVERPTYDRTLLGLQERGAEIHAIELQTDGIDTVALREELEGGLRPALVHVIPNFQNPAGYTLSLEKRKDLVEMAAQYEFLLFEDDPYRLIRFAGDPLPTMLELDGGRGNVAYASSFSKTVCPGVRVGYLIGPAELIGRIVASATNTYISPNMLAEATVFRFCESGRVDESVEVVSDALAKRVEALAGALAEHLPEAKFTVPEGGYFMWVELPEGTDVAAIQELAAGKGVQFVKGDDFLIDGAGNTLRLAYSGVTADEIPEGVRRLAEAYREVS